MGFNFFPPSPRYVTPAQAAALSARSPGGPPRVGLFVDPTPETIAATLDTVRLDILQLYGALDLPPMRARFGLPIWRAVGIASASDLPTAAGGADRLVLEAKPPPQATRPGGNAARFDWSLLRGWNAPAPWILAGGLTVDNVAEAIRTTGRRRGGRVLGGRTRARREGSCADPRVHRQCPRGTTSGSAVPRRADADALGLVHVAAWREAYTGLVPDEILAGLDPQQRAAMWREAIAHGATIHLAEQNGAIVGFGSSGEQRDPSLPFSGEIRALYVLQRAQRRGVGRMLMAAMAHDLLAQGHVVRACSG